MGTSPPGSPTAAPRWKPLDPHERRVLGVLVEKAKTTPAAYPMTVKAIVSGCNQRNNRDPLSALDDTDVENALGRLSTVGAASELDWLGRVPKYKHNAYEWLGVNKVELAVMAELLLRGAQALGDLRGRATRMEPIPDIEALRPVVDGLLARGLMVALTPPGRGQIVSHNLYSTHELAELKASFAGHVRPDTTPRPVSPPSRGSADEPAPGPSGDAGQRESAERIADWCAEIVELRAEVARLREQVRELGERLDATSG